MKKIGVILSGCGVFDGAEIHESVAILAALEKYDLQAVCFAPDVDQMHVINHYRQEVAEGETRNVLVEAARVARGNISPLQSGSADDLDGLILPGGFGAAKNLSDYAVKGDQMSVVPVVAEVLLKAYQDKKPIAAVCIAPVILAHVLKTHSPKLTLGADGADADNINNMGGQHQATTHEGVVTDIENRLVTGPCYMLEANIGQIMRGADAVVKQLKEMLQSV